MNLQQIAESYGFPYEEHEVHTSDGYILTLMRISHGRENADIPNRPPIFLVHSFLDSAVFWAFRGPELSPVFYLADSGYDVWLYNARGTSRSLEHETLNWQINNEYWDISWLDQSYDFDACIEDILAITGYENLAVAVANLYNSQFFTGMASRPEFYRDRLSVVLSFQPIFEFQHTTLPNYLLL
mmetsp:Transcript_32787/g.29072  ORF Transcript_32787/g.29072 Transcript_32787/m.29072 type:complete len:184 (-) Transcript_32787:615-1166(-)